jgi:GLPGLI family protein
MKSIYTLTILFFLCFKAHSQEHTYPFSATYEYDWQYDANDTMRLQEPMILLYSPEKSLFYSKNAHLIDSVIAANKGETDFTVLRSKIQSLPKSRARFTIEHDKKENKGNLYEDVMMNTYRIPYDPTLNWELVEADTMINGLSAKKATTTSGGRNWTAWYTFEVPIPDGPYKFSGLPGLVLMAYDADKHHIFTINEISQNPVVKSFEPKNKPVKASVKQVARARENRFESLKASGVTIKVDGGRMDQIKKQMNKYNNYIELAD